MKKLFTLFAALCCVVMAHATFDSDLPAHYDIGQGDSIFLSAQFATLSMKGTSFAYTWQRKSATGTLWTNLSSNSKYTISTGSRATSLKVSGLTASDVKSKYRVIVEITTSFGATSYDTSSVCTIYSEPYFIQRPQNQYYDEDDAYGDSEVSFVCKAASRFGTCSVTWADSANHILGYGDTLTINVNDGIRKVKCSVNNASAGTTLIGATAELLYWYDLTVLGEKVTERNYTDILGDGTLYFLNDTLYLDHVQWEDSDRWGDTNFAMAEYHLNIRCIGENKVICGFDGNCFETLRAQDLFITGDTLECRSGDSDCFFLNVNQDNGAASMQIKDMKFLKATVTSGGYSFEANPQNTDNEYLISLVIDNSRVEGTNMSHLDEIILVGDMTILTPGAQIGVVHNYYYNTDYEALVSASGSDYWANEEAGVPNYVIAPLVYDLWVCGTRVTASNKYNILGDGSLTYEPEFETLTFDGAHLVSNGTPAILYAPTISESSYLTLSVLSASVIEAANAEAAIKVVAAGATDPISPTFYIEGDSLTVTATQAGSSAILLTSADPANEGVDLILDGARYLSARGGSFGIRDNDNAATLEIRDSYVVANGIDNFTYVTWDATDLMVNDAADMTYQYGHFVDAASHVVTGDIVIRPVAKLFDLGSYDVDELNYADILGDGSASYDPATHVLTLSNVTLGGGVGINFEQAVPSLTIHVEGNCSITSALRGPIYTTAADTVIIEGDENATLTLTFNGHAASKANIQIANGMLLVRGGIAVSAYSTASDPFGYVVYAHRGITVDASSLHAETTQSTESMALNAEPTLIDAEVSEGAFDSHVISIVPKTNVGFEGIAADAVAVEKIIRDGRVLIIRGDRTFDALGREVK